MLLSMMRAKLHRVTVTQADLNYEGSIGISPELLEASGILPGEYIHVWNLTNGNRAQTYAMAADNPGEICPNGALAHLMRVGDVLILCTFCDVDAKEAKTHKGTVVLVKEGNQIKGILHK